MAEKKYEWGSTAHVILGYVDEREWRTDEMFQIVSDIGVTQNKNTFYVAMAKLVDSGDIVRTRHGHFRFANTPSPNGETDGQHRHSR